jgi:hypothetical protein
MGHLSRAMTYDEDERGIAYGRESYGDGVPIVVVGVTPHQGDGNAARRAKGNR